jgi:uncharacterized protein
VALAIGRYFDLPPFRHLRLEAAAVGYGLAATLPMLVVLRWCLRTAWPPMQRLVTLVEDQLRPYLAGASTAGIVLLSVLAGTAEEALFRGVIQTGLAGRFPAWTAVGVASVLFGMAHWLTVSYAVLAGLIGAYLGVLLIVTDNLLAPIIAHAAYDIVALSVLARRRLTPAVG